MAVLRIANAYRSFIWLYEGVGLPLPWKKPHTGKKRIIYFFRDAAIIGIIIWKICCSSYTIFINEFVDRMISQSTALGTALSLFSMFFYFKNREKLGHMVSEWEDLANQIAQNRYENGQYFLEVFRKDEKQLSIVGIVMNLVTGLCPAVYCFSGPLMQYFFGISALRVAISCPFEFAVPQLFPVVVFFQAFGYTSAGLVKLANELLIIRFIRIQICILKFISKFAEEIDLSETNQESRVKMKELIQIHQKWLMTCPAFIKIYSPTVVMYYVVLMSFTVQLMFYFVNSPANILQTSALVTFFIATVFQFYLMCHVADQLSDEAEKVAVSVYSTPWYRWDSKDSRQIQLIISMANRPIRVTAYNVPLFNINKEAFQSYVVNIVSAYMGLRTFMEREK